MCVHIWISDRAINWFLLCLLWQAPCAHEILYVCMYECTYVYSVFKTSLSPSGNWEFGVCTKETGRTESREQTFRRDPQTSHPRSLCWRGTMCSDASLSWNLVFFLKRLAPSVSFVCFLRSFSESFVAWSSEPAARPWTEAGARGGDDGRRLRQPHQPVLPPRQRGGGAQPEEGNVSEAQRPPTGSGAIQVQLGWLAKNRGSSSLPAVH